MINPVLLESSFQHLMDNLEVELPDGIIQVDLQLLRALSLLNPADDAFTGSDHALTYYFQVIETPEKITLFNDQFVVWIVPQLVEEEPATFALVALLRGEAPELELAFATTGVYNSSKMVLRILERFLEEIQENERLLARLSL